MAQKPAARATARKVKDRWKAKSWYNLLAPEMFNKQVVGETPAELPGSIVGRIAEVTVQDLTGDFAKMHIKLQFRVTEMRGNEALTRFTGHDMTPDYIRRLTRRKRTRTDAVVTVATKDGWILRVKPMAITDRRIQSAKQKVIRTTMEAVLKETAAKSSVGELVRQMISGDLAKAMAAACKPIQPIQRIEVRRSEVVQMGEESTGPAMEPAPPAEAPAPGPEGAAPVLPPGEAPPPPPEPEELPPPDAPVA